MNFVDGRRGSLNVWAQTCKQSKLHIHPSGTTPSASSWLPSKPTTSIKPSCSNDGITAWRKLDLVLCGKVAPRVSIFLAAYHPAHVSGQLPGTRSIWWTLKEGVPIRTEHWSHYEPHVSHSRSMCDVFRRNESLFPSFSFVCMVGNIVTFCRGSHADQFLSWYRFHDHIWRCCEYKTIR